MSIIYNNQIVAGKYKEQIINKADTINAGIIKISTQEEVDSGIDNTTAITPLYLSQKQDKLVAGDNIIMDENLIECNIYPDEQTIIQNDDGTFTNIGQLTKSGTIKIDWEGTEAEYTQAMLDGIIQPDWYCYITDDESIIDYADVANQKLSNLRPEGEARFDSKANVNLDNLTNIGEEHFLHPNLDNLDETGSIIINNKADINLSNLSEDGKSLIANYSMPSNRYIDLTLGASGSTYTAPANGWFIINKIAGSDCYYCALTNNNTGEYDFRGDYRTSPCTPRVYARRGDVIKAEYNATGALTYFRFYYAEGNK